MATHTDLLGGRRPKIYKGVAMLQADFNGVILHERFQKAADELFAWGKTIRFCQFRAYSLFDYANPFYRKAKGKRRKQSDGDEASLEQSDNDSGFATRSDDYGLVASSIPSSEDPGSSEEDLRTGREPPSEAASLSAHMNYAQQRLAVEGTQPNYSSDVYRVLSGGLIVYASDKWLAALKQMVKECFTRYSRDKFVLCGFPAEKTKSRMFLPSGDTEGELTVEDLIGSLKSTQSAKSVPSRMLYDGRVGKGDDHVTFGVREADEGIEQHFGESQLLLKTATIQSPQALKTMYGVSDRDLWFILARSIGRRMSFLGSTYYFNVHGPEHPELTIGDISVAVVDSNMRTDPVKDLLDAYVQALHDIAGDPEQLLIDPPQESRLPGNFETLAYASLDPGFRRELSRIISKGCIAVIVCSPRSGFTPVVIEWIEGRRKAPAKPKKRAR